MDSQQFPWTPSSARSHATPEPRGHRPGPSGLTPSRRCLRRDEPNFSLDDVGGAWMCDSCGALDQFYQTDQPTFTRTATQDGVWVYVPHAPDSPDGESQASSRSNRLLAAAVLSPDVLDMKEPPRTRRAKIMNNPLQKYRPTTPSLTPTHFDPYHLTQPDQRVRQHPGFCAPPPVVGRDGTIVKAGGEGGKSYSLSSSSCTASTTPSPTWSSNNQKGHGRGHHRQVYATAAATEQEPDHEPNHDDPEYEPDA